jgi:hypothetical protein
VDQPRLFIDEDACEEAVVSALRRLGFDVLTVHEANRLALDDADQLRYASSLGRAIYSLNARHFAQLHRDFLARGEDHAGIIVIPRQRYTIGEKVHRLQELFTSSDVASLRNSLSFL